MPFSYLLQNFLFSPATESAIFLFNFALFVHLKEFSSSTITLDIVFGLTFTNLAFESLQLVLNAIKSLDKCALESRSVFIKTFAKQFQRNAPYYNKGSQCRD